MREDFDTFPERLSPELRAGGGGRRRQSVSEAEIERGRQIVRRVSESVAWRGEQR